MVQLSEVLSTENVGVATNPLALTNETVVTLDVVSLTGTHNNSRITLQHSPNGVLWVSDTHSTNGNGSMTVQIATNHIRACVLHSEGSAATARIFITAK